MPGIKLERNTSGKLEVRDNTGRKLKRMTAVDLEQKLKSIGCKNFQIRVENEYTYIQTGSGVICINGVWYEIP